MKKIRKIMNSVGVVSKVLNIFSDSKENTYSCDYLNNSLFGTVLYDNSTGTNQDITLSESVENYRYIDIEFKSDAVGNYSVQRVYAPFNKRAVLMTQLINLSGSYTGVFMRLANVLVNEKSISFKETGGLYGGGTAVNQSFVYITKVIGYK